jgi:branched-chain amino acid transport system substrate-binding protein
MKKLFLFFGILIGIVTTSVYSVYSQEKIKFGAALSLTGKLAKEGNLVKNGYELWKEVVNKKVESILVAKSI